MLKFPRFHCNIFIVCKNHCTATAIFELRQQTKICSNAEIWARILLSPKSRQTTTSIDIYQTRKVVHAEFKNEREVFWKPVFSAKRNYSSEWKQDKRDLINHLNNLPPLINLVFAVSIPLLRRNKCNKISRVTKWQPQAPSIQLMSLPFQSLLFCRRLSTVASLAS